MNKLRFMSLCTFALASILLTSCSIINAVTGSGDGTQYNVWREHSSGACKIFPDQAWTAQYGENLNQTRGHKGPESHDQAQADINSYLKMQDPDNLTSAVCLSQQQ